MQSNNSYYAVQCEQIKIIYNLSTWKCGWFDPAVVINDIGVFRKILLCQFLNAFEHSFFRINFHRCTESLVGRGDLRLIKRSFSVCEYFNNRSKAAYACYIDTSVGTKVTKAV